MIPRPTEMPLTDLPKHSTLCESPAISGCQTTFSDSIMVNFYPTISSGNAVLAAQTVLVALLPAPRQYD